MQIHAAGWYSAFSVAEYMSVHTSSIFIIAY